MTAPPPTPLDKALTRGTHRACVPGDTLDRMRPWLRKLGVTRLANVTGLDVLGIPTVVAVRPNGRSLSVTQGKGLSLEAAKASALMEACELWHAEQVRLPLRWAPVGAIREAGTLDVDRLPRMVPQLDADAGCCWVEGLELFSGADTPVPYELVHMDLTLPLPPGSGLFALGSNGLASGNHLEEALVHGLCEVIERDARTLFFLAPERVRASRRLRLDTLPDGVCRDLVEHFKSADLMLAAWDITHDVAVPAYLAAAIETTDDTFRAVGMAYGSGCHPDARVAWTRALTEVAQARLTRISGARDDILQEDFDALRSRETIRRDRAALEQQQPYLAFDERLSHVHATFEEDVQHILRALHVVGLRQVVAVDLSRSGWPVRVLRVVVPGLEGIVEAPGYLAGERAQRVLETHHCMEDS